MKPWQIVVAVLLGVACGLLEPGRFAYALGHATLYVFLPALLFEAAWNLNVRAIRRQWRAIALLAGPGVLLTATIVTGLLAIARVPFGAALLTGAVLSATDPIAVVAVFRRLRVPVALATIVECESLFNDAVAVVLYRAILAALVLGSIGAGTIAVLALTSAAAAVAGVACGIGVAYAAASVLRRRNGVAQIAATMLCAYGVYFAADFLHLSGIFATIAFGIALHYFERKWIAVRLADEVRRFWDIAALVANASVFFLVGAAFEPGRVAQEPLFVAICLASIMLSRVVVAGLLLPAGYPPGWLGVIRVAGMRGGLSLALALALPSWVQYRQTVVVATFAVAIATLVAGWLAVERVVRPVERRG